MGRLLIIIMKNLRFIFVFIFCFGALASKGTVAADELPADVQAAFTNLTALFSREALGEWQDASPEYETERLEALYQSADGKIITLKSTYQGYDTKGTLYICVGRDSNPDEAYTTTTPPSVLSTYFVVEYAGNGCYYLKSKANGKYLGPTTGYRQRINADKTREAAGLYVFRWNVEGNNNSHAVLHCQNASNTNRNGNTIDALHRAGEEYLVPWTVNAAASFWTIDPPQVNFTYRFVSEDSKVTYDTKPAKGGFGEAFPAVSLPYGVVPAFPERMIAMEDEGASIDVPCTFATSFQFADSYDHINMWYNIAISDGMQLFNYVEDATQMTLSATKGTEDKYLFALVGNPFEGYKIYNKAATDTKILSAPAPRADVETGAQDYVIVTSTTVPEGNNERWDFVVSTSNANGFFMARHGESVYVNKRTVSGVGTILSFWTGGADKGSTIYFTEKYEPEKLVSDKYYQLINKKEGYLLIEDYNDGGKLKGMNRATIQQPGLALWKITGDAEQGFTLTNAITNHTVQRQSVWNTQFTAADATGYAFTALEDDGYYAFHYSTSDVQSKWSLHGAASTSVLTWTYENAEASRWLLHAVEVSDAELLAMRAPYETYLYYKENVDDVNAAYESYNEQLGLYFDDLACTQLKATAAAMTDEELRADMEAKHLPAPVCDMAIRVKHDQWDADSDRNHYEKLFRLADYEIYSERTSWRQITQTGAFAELVNPTGIVAKTDDILYLYVSEDAPADASLFAELAKATDFNGKTYPLHRGLNVLRADRNGEFFIGYFCNNTERYLNEFPDIKVHIEGGVAEGCWDMSRGMDNTDWAWLLANAMKQQIIHVKGKSTVLTVERNRVQNEMNPEGVLTIWDFAFDAQQRLLGHDGQWNGRYRPVINPRESYGGNPNWPGNYGTNHPGTISHNGMFNYNNLVNDRFWEMLHEEAHGHQYPVNFAGLTEVSNNAYAQMVTYEFGRLRSRGVSTPVMIQLFNEGYTWVDYTRAMNHRRVAHYEDCLHVANQMFYKLYLYFHVLGHKPDFWPRVADYMRDHGGITKGGSAQNPTLYYNDYFKFAEACAEVSQTDLSEFFQAYGFFKYYDDCVTVPLMANDGVTDEAQYDVDAEGIRIIGDYGHYYMKMPMKGNEEDENRINSLITRLKSYPKKAPSILFIDDHIESTKIRPESFVAKLEPSLIGQPMKDYWNLTNQGDFGQYTDFTGKNSANSIYYEIANTTVTVYGEGMLGFKVYDENGNLIWLANKATFSVNEEIASKLQDGTYTLVAALGDDTNLPLASPSTPKYAIDVYSGSEDNVQHYLASGTVVGANVPYTTNGGCDVPALEGNAMMLLPEVSSAQRFGNSQLPDALAGINVFYNDGTAENPKWNAFGVSFTDKADFYLPDGDYSAGFITYKRTNTGGLNSVCLPFDVDASQFGDGSKAYEFSLVDDGRISLIEVKQLEAGKFYIVDCPADADDWQLGGDGAILGQPSDEVNATGAFCGGAVPDGVYKLNADGTKFGITKDGKGCVAPFRGYLNPAAPAGIVPTAMPFTLVSLGDVNGDGVVSIADVSELVDRLNATMASSGRRQAAPATTSPKERQARRAADVDCDGNLSQSDMQILISRILRN